MMAIRNKEQLVNNGKTPLNRKARKIALEALEQSLNSVDPAQIIRSKLSLKNSLLRIDDLSFDLNRFQNIFIVGGGKASGSMAEAIEQILGKRIVQGLINIPQGSKNKTSIVKLHEAGHPFPDDAGVEGTRLMLEIAEKAGQDDLVVCLISGGGSSLMPLPRGSISLEDKRKITQELLKCGATINEINTVRKHISDFKGGWLAKKAYPATILNLILSDVVGDPLDFIASGPTVPDSTTFKNARQVLERYDLWATAPGSIKKVLSDGEKGMIPETPKNGDDVFRKVYNVIVGNNRRSSLAAREYLKSASLNSLLLTAALEGEARHVGTILASVARETLLSGNPVPKPAGIVVGGETTVTVTGKGLGGRNQEIVLSAALNIKKLDGVVIASLSTDGIDGPTDAAGAIADGNTVAAALNMGLEPKSFLSNNDSYHFFSKVGDLIFTGPTGTNVNDVSLVIVV